MSERHLPILAHERHGHGPVRAIVLHEFFSSLRTYDSLRTYLDPDRYSLVFADVRGYGQSRRLTGRYDPEELTADTLRLADAVGFDRFGLIGHSMNGLGIQHTIVDDWLGPRRIQRGVAITPVPSTGLVIDGDAKAFFQQTTTDDEALRQALMQLTGSVYGAGFIEERVRANRSTSQSEVMLAYLDRLIFAGSVVDRARSAGVETPLLFITGERDMPGMRRADIELARGGAFKAARHEDLPASGHYPMLETPAALAAALDRFLGD